MGKYLAKPVAVEAFEVIDDPAEMSRLAEWSGGSEAWSRVKAIAIQIELPTRANVGDWIVKSPSGFSILSPEQLEETYWTLNTETEADTNRVYDYETEGLGGT